MSAAVPPGVPAFFKCPISLDLMEDPVSVSSGITYDRSSIQKWLDDGHNTCPATMQVLASQELIPNHTLRRIIQAWCAQNNKSAAVVDEKPLPPKPALDMRRMVGNLEADAHKRMDALKQLKEKVSSCSQNRDLLMKVGVFPLLVSILSMEPSEKEAKSEEEALGLLALLHLDESCRKTLLAPQKLGRIVRLLSNGSMQARVNAAVIVEALAVDRESKLTVGSSEGVLEGLMKLLKEDFHCLAVKSSIKALLAICSPIKNRVRAVEAGIVPCLVELLPDAEKQTLELLFALLDCICGCAEGRAAVCDHALTIPAITKKLFKVSDTATEYAIGTLWALCKYSPDDGIKKRMIEAGIFAKLFFFLQIGYNPRTKQKAGDLLKFLRNAYKDCLENTCLHEGI